CPGRSSGFQTAKPQCFCQVLQDSKVIWQLSDGCARMEERKTQPCLQPGSRWLLERQRGGARRLLAWRNLSVARKPYHNAWTQNGSSRPSASRRGGTGPIFTPFERIGQTAARWQDITPSASGPGIQNLNIEIRNSFRETETRTSIHVNSRAADHLMRNLRESAKSVDNVIACRR